MIRYAILVFVVLGCLWAAAGAQPEAMNETLALDVTTPYPTLIHLAVEWRILGDDDLDGVVSVRFREIGTSEWRDGMPLRRVPKGRLAIPRRWWRRDAEEVDGPPPLPNRIFEWANKHSGSLFDLMSDTEYEIELSLHDPDGGDAVKRVRARTRPEPRAMPNAPITRVTPETLRTLKPTAGDVVLLGAGDYGTFVARFDGEPGKPIVYRSDDGAARFTQIDLIGRSYVHVEGVTVVNPERRGKGIDLMGAEFCAIRWCTSRASYGVSASSRPGARNCYVADNDVEGPSVWTSESMGANGDNLGEGIRLTGPGNVICFNRVKGFRDCISTMESGAVEDQICVDIYNNDIYLGADDGIEADYASSNCRIIQNRLTNCFVGLSSQPSLGGPTYFIRNAMYNLVYSPFKFHNRSTGNVALHNTSVKIGDGMVCYTRAVFDHSYFRNNLCIGGPAGEEKWGGYGAGRGVPVWMAAPGDHSDFDYDALGAVGMPFQGKIGDQRFEGFDEMVKGPHEMHALQVDMSVFDGVLFPSPPVPEREAVDLRPKEGSSVVDVGFRIANVNDGYVGAGPDIGAYEVGGELPHYGPREKRLPNED